MTRFIILVGLAAALWAAGCHSSHDHKAEAETTFRVTSPLQKDTLLTNAYVCQIHSIRHIELRALEKGYLQHIYVDEGQYVKQGQLMFKIMPTLYAAEVRRAQAEARVAEIEYQNTRSLADSNIVSPNELALAQAHFEKAQAELALAEVHLNFTEVRAPFDGLMDRLHVREGSLLEEGELLTSLSDNHKLWVYFNVPEPEYLDYRRQQQDGVQAEVRLLMANNQVFDHPGVVETIEGEFNPETGNIAFRATFPNPDLLLRHGETGNILMTVPIRQGLLIPQKATFDVLDKKYVYVIAEAGTVEPREISVAAELPHIYVLSGGLRATDKILLEGLRLVREGDKISYRFEAPEQVIGNLELYAE